MDRWTASAASVQDCKIRDAQNALTEEGLQQCGTPISQMAKKRAHTLPHKREGTSSEHQTQCLAKQVTKWCHVYSGPPVAGNPKISSYGPQPRL